MYKQSILLLALIGATLASAKAMSGGLSDVVTATGQTLDQKVNAMPQGDAVRGKTVYKQMMCGTCHGVLGKSSSRNYPTLNGQGDKYIVKMMLDYQYGQRWHNNPTTSPMTQLARAMDDQQIADVSSYLADQQQRAWTFAKPLNKSIETLVMTVDSTRMITACAGCHGMKGQGVATMPALVGQVPEYFKKATKAFRSKEGNVGVNPMMRMVADGLTDAEIDALADYYAALPTQTAAND